MSLSDGRMRRQPSSKSPVAVLTGFTTTRVWATYSTHAAWQQTPPVPSGCAETDKKGVAGQIAFSRNPPASPLACARSDRWARQAFPRFALQLLLHSIWTLAECESVCRSRCYPPLASARGPSCVISGILLHIGCRPVTVCNTLVRLDSKQTCLRNRDAVVCLSFTRPPAYSVTPHENTAKPVSELDTSPGPLASQSLQLHGLRTR